MVKQKKLFNKIMLMEEKIIRPTTKPEAIKGKLLKYQGTDYCEFMPQRFLGSGDSHSDSRTDGGTDLTFE